MSPQDSTKAGTHGEAGEGAGLGCVNNNFVVDCEEVAVLPNGAVVLFPRVGHGGAQNCTPVLSDHGVLLHVH